MKKNIWAPVLILIMIALSCGSEKDSGSRSKPGETELPPSLQSEESDVLLVQLTEKQQDELKIETIAIDSRLINYSIVAPGVVFPAPQHSSLVSTPIDGQILRIYKYEGDPVRKGETIFEIQSLEFGNLVSEYLQAFAEERFQRNRMNRMKQLVEETISSASELERAASEYERASAILRAAYSKLRAIGVSEKEISEYTNGENILPLLKIHSPIDGIIESVFVELGQSVNALENLSRLLDIRKVMIRGYVSPDDAMLISAGDSVLVMKQDRRSVLAATVTSINPGMDENNRSVVANIMIPTLNGWPKPGENLQLEISTSSQKEMISIPVEAITYDGNQAIVFVNRGNGIYERRPIAVTSIRDRSVLVETGLTKGDVIAVTRVFSLKALLRFDILSEE
jgi:membrane fusion protein, heavy metal efflux system